MRVCALKSFPFAVINASGVTRLGLGVKAVKLWTGFCCARARVGLSLKSPVAYSPLAALLAVAVLSPQCHAQPQVPYSQNPSYESPWFSCNGEGGEAEAQKLRCATSGRMWE